MSVNLVEEVRLSVRMCTHMHTHTNTHTPHTLAFSLVVFSLLLLLLMFLSQDLSTLHYLVMSRAIFCVDMLMVVLDTATEFEDEHVIGSDNVDLHLPAQHLGV